MKKYTKTQLKKDQVAAVIDILQHEFDAQIEDADGGRFDVIINGNSGTTTQIYEFVQHALRSGSDIDADVSALRRGDIQNELLKFVGDQLVTTPGVYIDNFLVADTNNITFTDSGGTPRNYPFIASIELLFNDNAINDANAVYRMFFTNTDVAVPDLGYDFGTQDAIMIQDDQLELMSGSVDGFSSISYGYAYDTNEQRGQYTSESNVPWTGVTLGLNTAQYVVVTGTMVRSTTNSANYVAALERNYSAG